VERFIRVNQFSSHTKYRADIDGLRAIAVLLVVGFHAFPSWFKGGFTGVDIFFVISGFLISSIIFNSLENNKFSFIEFYRRRIKRIFPSLLIMLIACFMFGWFTLLSDEFKQLNKHILGGAGFISNLVFWKESGYFDNAADTKPLLHLWSLGVEEQFYFFAPLFFWFAWKKKVNLLVVTISIALLSFILNLMAVNGDSSASYYLPQNRFWEILLGAMLAYIMINKPKFVKKFFHKNLSWAGILFILSADLLITKENHFPGWWALIPTIGTLFIIAAGPEGWLNRNILANRLLVWIGLISYPLYLWHWPLLVFLRVLGSQTPTPAMRILAIILAIVLSWLTYIVVEKPLRNGGHEKIKTVVLFLLMTLVGLAGFFFYLKNGDANRQVVKMNIDISKDSGLDGGDGGKTIHECGITNIVDKKLFWECSEDSRQKPKYALLGDSKAASLFGGLVRTSTEAGRWLIIGGTGPQGAPIPIISTNEIYKSHQILIRAAVDSISENRDIETVVLMTSTRGLFKLKTDYSIDDLSTNPNFDLVVEGLTNTIKEFISAGKKIIIVTDNPTLPDPRDCLNRRTSLGFINKLFSLSLKTNPNCHLELKNHLLLSKKYRDLLNELQSKFAPNVIIFETTKYMCDVEKGVCLPYKNGRAMYSITDHISDYAAGLIGKDLNLYLQNN
jgi:peptidoglycan/LPS O-acetylase OafA/YrhL